MKQITETRVKWSCPEIAKDVGELCQLSWVWPYRITCVTCADSSPVRPETAQPEGRSSVGFAISIFTCRWVQCKVPFLSYTQNTYFICLSPKVILIWGCLTEWTPQLGSTVRFRVLKLLTDPVPCEASAWSPLCCSYFIARDIVSAFYSDWG